MTKNWPCRRPYKLEREMWFRKLKLKLLAVAYLTVSQLSTGLKHFGAFLFLNGQIEKKKSHNPFLCVFIFQMSLFGKSIIDGMQPLKTEPY